MDDGTIELIYYCIGNLFLSTIASVISKKLGIVLSCIISLLSILFTIGLGTMPVGNYERILIFGLFFFPGLTWFGFWLGRTLRKKLST